MRNAIVLSGILMSCAGLLPAQALFPKPIKVIGDPNFVATVSNPLAFSSVGPNWIEGRELNAPAGIALDTSVNPPIVYIADSRNNRVLGYRYATQLIPGSPADVIIGQVDQFSNQAQNPANGGRQTGLNNPTGLAVDSAGNLYVADTGNNRILRFPQPFAAANFKQFPSLVIGQKTFSTSTANLNGIGASTLGINGTNLGRTGIAFDASGNLWVADSGNNRVLRFPAAVLSAGPNFPAADLVIGQPDFTTSAPATSITSLTAFSGPNGVSLDSNGKLYVSDHFRVLVFNAPLTTGQTAASILGLDASATAITPTATSLASPSSVLGLSTGPFVADTANNRVMLFDAQPQTPSGKFSPAAKAVVGQLSFTANLANQGKGDASSSTLSAPIDLAATSQELYIVDSGNNRVLVFSLSPTGVSGAATRVIGQLDFPYTGSNIVDGRGFAFPGSFPAGAVLDNSVSPAHLYVPDTFNHRVLGFRDFTHLQNGQPADIVIGQPDFNRSVVNYPSGDPNTPTAASLNQPTAVVVDSSGNLYVVDPGNSRVTRYPAPFNSGKTALEEADLVIGQTGFTSFITDATSSTMNSPVALAFTPDGADTAKPDKGYLVVADASQNRVLFFPKPFVSGMSATIVLGQTNFTASNSSSGTAGFNSPRGVAVDPQGRVLVADTGNVRVEIFDQPSNLGNGAAPLLTLPTTYTLPLSIGVGPAGDFWVTDTGASRLYHYPAVSNLPLNNNAADAILPALAPHSCFVDAYNNLLLTDGIHRVLYFVPQLNLTNAATYSTRALSAGTVAALFPTVAANPIANGTATAPSGQFPLPTTLSDTQILVGATPVPLLFVSPGQDNIILPQGLPTSGSANLLAVRPSTGQILAGAEVQLTSASPGLFTLGALGSGPALAVNFQDGSINSTSHPVLRGQYVILYGTGVGPVPNPPADGMPATGQPAADLPQVLIASSGSTTSATGVVTQLPAFIPANVTYSGLAPGFAGLWQINVQIPQNAQSGNSVVIKVFEKDIPNIDQASSLTTTLAVN